MGLEWIADTWHFKRRHCSNQSLVVWTHFLFVSKTSQKIRPESSKNLDYASGSQDLFICPWMPEACMPVSTLGPQPWEEMTPGEESLPYLK